MDKCSTCDEIEWAAGKASFDRGLPLAGVQWQGDTAVVSELCQLLVVFLVVL